MIERSVKPLTPPRLTLVRAPMQAKHCDIPASPSSQSALHLLLRTHPSHVSFCWEFLAADQEALGYAGRVLAASTIFNL